MTAAPRSALGSINPHGIARHLLESSHVGSIFVRAFRYLLDNKVFFQLHDHEKQTARRTPAYGRLAPLFAQHFSIAAHRAAQENGDQDTASLPTAVLLDIRRTLTAGLRNASAEDVFPILLALLDSIDRRFSGSIHRSQTAATEGNLLPLRNDRPVPKPWPALGMGALDIRQRPPEYAVGLNYLLLERYFARLTVTPTQHYQPLTPALYHAGATQRFDDASVWRVALVSIISDVADISFQFNDTLFWADQLSLERRSQVISNLNWALEIAAQHKVDLTVLPELNTDSTIFGRLVDSAYSRGADNLVIAGSLHLPDPLEPARFQNRPYVLNAAGSLDWPYWKHDPMYFPFDNVPRAEALGRSAPHVVAMDAPIGRLCVVICKDFMHGAIREAIIALRPTFVVVPAMTTADSLWEFRAGARALASCCGAITVLCNSALHLRKTKKTTEKLLGFVHPNVRTGMDRMPRHSLPTNAAATVGIYEFRLDQSTHRLNEVQKLVYWTVDGRATKHSSTAYRWS